MPWLPKKCVVVPVDFSAASNEAVKTALSLVDKPEHVHVIHAVKVPEFIPYGEFVWVVEPKEWADKAAQHLRDYLATHPEFGEVKSATVTGDPSDAIIKYSKDNKADLIVMPCHGLRGLQRLLLGSVTEGVLRHATCEVLVQRYPE